MRKTIRQGACEAFVWNHQSAGFVGVRIAGIRIADGSAALDLTPGRAHQLADAIHAAAHEIEMKRNRGAAKNARKRRKAARR